MDPFDSIPNLVKILLAGGVFLAALGLVLFAAFWMDRKSRRKASRHE
jgi:hypothetical protein